jgi:hypothetical protein
VLHTYFRCTACVWKNMNSWKNDFHMMLSIIKLWKGNKYVICRVVATSWFKIQLHKLNMKGFVNSIGFSCMSLITTHKYNKMWVAKPQFLLLINDHGCNFEIGVFFCIQSSVSFQISKFQFCVKCTNESCRQCTKWRFTDTHTNTAHVNTRT